jgi:hypothetical protein
LTGIETILAEPSYDPHRTDEAAGDGLQQPRHRCHPGRLIVPTVNGTVADLSHIAAWVALGVSLIAYAQVWLERL